jgi:hypothetical protein
MLSQRTARQIGALFRRDANSERLRPILFDRTLAADEAVDADALRERQAIRRDRFLKREFARPRSSFWSLRRLLFLDLLLVVDRLIDGFNPFLNGLYLRRQFAARVVA